MIGRSSDLNNLDISHILKNYNEFRAIINHLKGNNAKGKDLLIFLENFFRHFKSNIDDTILSKIYGNFLEEPVSYHLASREKMEKKLDISLQNKKNYLITSLILSLFNNIIDSEKINIKFGNNDDLNYFIIKDIYNAGNYNSTLNLAADKYSNFYVIKNYTEVSEEVIQNEIQILKTNFNQKNRMSYQSSFIAHLTPNEDYKIIMPYYPNNSLKSFISNCNKINLPLSLADKFVLIYEIALGMKQLHENHIYHLNLSNISISIDANRNAYITNFGNDVNNENNQTRLNYSFYYRHPNLIKNPKNVIIADSYNEEYTKCDIYSFGILVYEIFTMQSPDKKFYNITRQARLNILTNQYHQFLFDQLDDKIDDYGMRKVIKKCMECEYNCFQNVINDIDQIISDHLNELKDEIEYRISHAADPCTYKCKLSDLVFNYYYNGSEESKDMIQFYINQCGYILDINNSNKITDDDNIISFIFNFFDIKNEKTQKINHTIAFEEIFNSIIRTNALKLLEYKDKNLMLSPNQNKLMELSMKAINYFPNLADINCTENLSNFIPITSLDKFIQSVKEPESIKLFLYMISKELLEIHSKNLYHGEISKESIGIYYNNETKTFVPLIIPFYFYYKNRKGNAHHSQNIKSIEKEQNKDVKNFLAIIRDFEDVIAFIPSDIFGYKTMFEIFHKLYNTNLESDPNFKQTIEKYNYSAFELTFPVLYDIFACLDKNDPLYENFNRLQLRNASETYLDVVSAIKHIYQFSNEKINNLKEPIDDNDIDIKNLLIKIKNDNEKAYKLYYQTKSSDSLELKISTNENSISIKKNTVKENEIPKQIEQINFTNASFLDKKLKETMVKFDNFSKKYVFRYLYIYDMSISSLYLLISRYIHSLNKKLNYKIQIRQMRKRDEIRNEDIIKIASRIGCRTEISIDKNVIIFVEKNN